MSTSVAAQHPHTTASSLVSPARARLLVVLVMLAAGAAGFAVAGHPAAADPALTRLLRAMALVKVFMAAAAGAALYWRLASPIVPVRLAAYVLAAAAMAAGPGLIWNTSNIAAGAALLHGGLLGTILLLWRDPGLAARLEQVIAERRKQAALF